MNLQNHSTVEISATYQQHIARYTLEIKKLRKKKAIIAVSRLCCVLLAVIIAWYLWPAKTFVTIEISAFIIVLIVLVFRDADATVMLKNDERLILVNQHEINAIEFVLHGAENAISSYDSGERFADPLHPYASDLDLFGKSSLFQWINRCHAEQSKQLLAFQMKNRSSASAIPEKQAAATELSKKQIFCQQFQSTAMEYPLTLETEKKLLGWMDADTTGFKGNFWKWFQHIYPVFPICLFAAFMNDSISSGIFSACLLLLFVIHFFINRKNAAEFNMLLNMEPEIGCLYKQLDFFEHENFSAIYLKTLQENLKPAGYSPATASLNELAGILKRIEWRGNLIINAFLQLFFIWDLRLILQIIKWRKKNGNRVAEWIKILTQAEVSISTASLVYNNPQWSFPEVHENYFQFEAEAIGHPLIGSEQRVDNDFSLQGKGKLALITGSNMAGKSTFLRSLGVNTVLALMGAPVSAKRMKISSVELISSMRVADNLTENTSTFYAELKKLKFIIDEVNSRKPVFILLDEVLRGTNSDDRHHGSRALVRQLLKGGAATIMATHDTELAFEESANHALFNYHFDGRIDGDNLYFDYKLKKGICESLNATALMKKIGIDFQD